jgi:hypothetical protein
MESHTAPKVQTYEEFILQVLHAYNRQKDKPTSKPYGRIAYAELRLSRPDLAAQVAATEKDPFSSDDNLDAFWDHLKANWSA